MDAGPYGLSRRRRWTTADDGTGVEVPYFDNNTRPRSLVLPWRPARPVLYGVQDAGCHRALYDHCARTAGALSERHVRALREWLNATVLPLVTTASSTARWYPALWGARLAARQLDAALATAAAAATAADGFYDYYSDEFADADESMTPNGNFYATFVLVSTFVCWTAALCLHR